MKGFLGGERGVRQGRGTKKRCLWPPCTQASLQLTRSAYIEVGHSIEGHACSMDKQQVGV